MKEPWRDLTMVQRKSFKVSGRTKSQLRSRSRMAQKNLKAFGWHIRDLKKGRGCVLYHIERIWVLKDTQQIPSA